MDCVARLQENVQMPAGCSLTMTESLKHVVSRTIAPGRSGKPINVFSFILLFTSSYLELLRNAFECHVLLSGVPAAASLTAWPSLNPRSIRSLFVTKAQNSCLYWYCFWHEEAMMFHRPDRSGWLRLLNSHRDRHSLASLGRTIC